MKLSRVAAILYAPILLATVVGSALLFARGPSFRTDIFSLLPPIHRDPVLESVTKAHAETFAKKVVILVQGPADRAAEREAERIADDMVRSGLFATVQSKISLQDLAPSPSTSSNTPFSLLASECHRTASQALSGSWRTCDNEPSRRTHPSGSKVSAETPSSSCRHSLKPSPLTVEDTHSKTGLSTSTLTRLIMS